MDLIGSKPFVRDQFKGIASSNRRFPTLGLACLSGINSPMQHSPGIIPGPPRFQQGDLRVLAKRDRLLLAIEAIRPSPELGATPRYQDVQAFSIDDLVGSRFGLQCPQFDVGERHVGILEDGCWYMARFVPTISLAADAHSRTSADLSQ